MARTELDRAVLPSLLDRLTDENPRDPADRVISREESARVFRRSVQRDVEWLLNSRRTMIDAGPDFPEVRRSVHQYGLPDTAGSTYSSLSGRSQLSDDIADTLRRFEPRLANVVVRLLETDQVKSPQVRFTIEATLRMDPSPEQIVFDTVLEVASGTYDIATPS